MFLTEDEIKALTGRTVKRLQCEQLRKNGIPFFVNASGRPVVAKSAIEGGKVEQISKVWRSAATG